MIDTRGLSRLWIQPALYGVVAFLPFSIAISELFIVVLVVGVLAHVGLSRSFSEFRSSLLYAVAAYIVISLISALLCEINPKSVSEVSHLLLYAFLFAGIYMGRRGMFTKWHLYLFLVAVAFGAVNGIVQYFNEVGILGRQAHHDRFPLRITGTFSNSLTYSGFYGMSLFFILPFMQAGRRGFRILVAGVLLLLLAALVLAYARGALLAAVLTAFLFVFRRRKYVVHLIVILAVVAAAVWLLMPDFVSRFETAFREHLTVTAEQSRMVIWMAAWDFFLEKPVFGIGPGAFRTAFELWKPSPEYEAVSHAHNQYFEALSTTGMIGFLSFMSILAVIFRKLLGSIKRSGEDNAHPMVRGAFYGLVFLCLSSFFENHFSDEEIFNLFSLLIGLGLAYAGDRSSEQVSAEEHLLPV
jgi:O-antigen ligase